MGYINQAYQFYKFCFKDIDLSYSHTREQVSCVWNHSLIGEKSQITTSGCRVGRKDGK